MIINKQIDVDRTNIPKYLKDIMDELDYCYLNNNECRFCLLLSNIVTLTSCAEANHKINDKTFELIRLRYGIV